MTSRRHRRRQPAEIDFPPDEEWLELPVDEAYLVSTHGRLYSTLTRRILIPQPGARPGESMYWRLGRRRLLVRCSHWVLTTLGPPRPSDFWVADHFDGDRANLWLQNLYWRPRLTNEQLATISRSRFAPPPEELTS